MIFMVAANLNDEDHDYAGFHQDVQALGPWFHYLKGVWLVDTQILVADISARLQVHITKVDYFLVMRVTNPHQGWLPPDAWKWINERSASL